MPHPGLGQIDELAAKAREAGLDIKLEVTSPPQPLPSAVDSAAYRILQESITNVIRHVGPTRVTVALDYGADALEVRVTDEGADAMTAGSDRQRTLRRARPRDPRHARALSSCWAASSTPGRGRAAGSRSRPGCRWPRPERRTVSSVASTGAPIKVLLADDEGLVRSGFRCCSTPRTTSRWWARPPTAPRPWSRPAPPGPTSYSWTSGCRSWTGSRPPAQIARTRGLEQVRVLILTTYDTDAYVFEALQAGASGFLLKDAGPAELLHAIRVVAAGEALLAPRITRRLIAQFTARTDRHPGRPRTGWRC